MEGGKFMKTNNVQYVDGVDKEVPNIDEDMMSLFVIEEFVEAVGAEVWKALYYVEPPLGLGNGLRVLKSDSDVLQMVAALDDERRVHIYVDHEGIDIFKLKEFVDETADDESIEVDNNEIGEVGDDGHKAGQMRELIHLEETDIVWDQICIPIPLVSVSIGDDLSAVQSNEDGLDAETNTAESVNNSLEICLKDKFSSLTEIKRKISNYAFLNGYDIRYTKHEKQRIEAKCREGCKWRLYASEVTNEESFQVKRLNSNHQCDRIMTSRHATTQWVANRFWRRFQSQPNWKIASIIETVREECKVNITPSLAIRARKQAAKVDSTIQYKQLGSYKEEILRYNPGSTFIIDVDRVEHKFERLYMCLDACKRGLLAGCRPVMSLDGCHLKGGCSGQLLIAIGVDANDGLYPFAVAVVDVESKESWKWFVKLLLTDIESARGEGWTFISDQQKGLEAALQEVVPAAEVRFCVRHMYMNFKKKFRGKVYKEIMTKASNETIPEMFVKEMERLRSFDEAAYKYLSEYDVKRWCKHAFSHISKCDLTLNNQSESFNALILLARKQSILTMIEMIRSGMMERICLRHEQMEKHVGLLCPRIQKKLKIIIEESTKWTATVAGNDKFQVREKYKQFVVDFGNATCTCNYWQLTGIPCVHAVSCITFRRKDVNSYVDRFYHRQTYLMVYSHFIEPMNGLDMWPPSVIDEIKPPIVKKLPGRPRKRRMRDADEPKDKSKMRKVIRCSKCRGLNHNARSCKGVRIEASTSTSRGRSTLFGFSTTCIESQESSVQSRTR